MQHVVAVTYTQFLLVTCDYNGLVSDGCSEPQWV